MNKEEFKEFWLSVLNVIKSELESGDYKYFDHNVGLCSNQSRICHLYLCDNDVYSQIRNSMYAAYETWEFYSDNDIFPVPGEPEESPAIAYDRAIDLYGEHTQYGRMRRNLLDHLIKFANTLLF